MLDAAIPLQVKEPSVASPIATVGQLMNIRDMASQVGLRNAQTLHAQQEAETIAAQAEQRRRDLADQNIIQQKMRDPKVTEKIYGNVDLSDLAGQIQPSTYTALQQKALEFQKGLLGNTKEQNAQTESAYGKLNDSATSLLQMRNPDGTLNLGLINQNLPTLKQNLAAEGVFKQAKIDQSQLPDAITDPNQLEGFQATLHGLLSAHAKVAELQKTQAEVAAKQQETKTGAANEAFKTLETAKQQRELDAAQYADALKQGPVAAQAFLATIPAERAAVFHGVTDPAQALHLGMTPEQTSTEGIKQAELAKQSQALQYQIQHGNAELAQGNARIGLEGARNAREEKIYDQTYGAGANPALVGVEPKLRSPAAAAAAKAFASKADADAAQQDMQTFIDQARHGNKTAQAYIDTEGVLNLNTGRGIKRVNRQEIDQYSGQGDLYDKLYKVIGGAASGEKNSPSVINAIDQLHKAISSNSEAALQQKLNGVDQAYRSQYGTVHKAQAPQAVAAPVPANRKPLSDIFK